MIGSVLTSRKIVLKGHPVSSLVLESPDTTKWIFSISSNGELVSFSGAAGTSADIKMVKIGGGEASLAINNNGEIQVKSAGDLSGSASLVSDFRMRSSDGIIYKFNITANEEIVLEGV